MNHNGPVFSIILPTHNRSGLIITAIQSVLDQTFQDFELIIVDDGSTDDTRAIVATFKDSRIKYFFKVNEERSIARNYGIAMSAGRYVNFLDSDDYFYPHHLDCANKYLQQHKFPELLHSGYELKNSAGATVLKMAVFEKNINENLIFNNVLVCAGFFIRRDVLTTISFIQNTHATISEDWYLWLRLAARFPIHVSNTVTSVVREHALRSLRVINPAQLERSLLLVIRELGKDPIFLEYYRSDFPYFIGECYSLIALHYSEVNRAKSFDYLFKSIRASPMVMKRKRFWAILKKLAIRRKQHRS